MEWKGVILYTKLTPLIPVRRMLPRPRLSERLSASLEHRVTLLQAGAGYGKSIALASFDKKDAQLVWYHLDPDDIDPLVFLLYLLHGFRQTLGSIIDAPLAVLQMWEGSGTALPWQNVVDNLINEIVQNVQTPILLILDDAHHLNQLAALDILDRLIRHAPANLHIILSVRTPIKLPSLQNLRIRGDVLDIGEHELAFSADEIFQLFRDHYGLTLSSADTDLLVRRTSGWAIALQLIWQGLPQGALSDVSQVLDRLTHVQDDLFTFLAQEVLDQQPEDVRHFMLLSSVLRYLTPELCSCVDSTIDSESQLRYLVDSGLFVEELQDKSLRYHPLFRDFLYQKVPDAERLAVHLTVAQCYEQRGDLEEAVYHYLNAHQFEQAAVMMSQLGRSMIQSGRLEMLAEWVGLLPLEAIEVQPMLLIYLGDVARLHSRFEQALASYRQAEDRFRQQNDLRGIGHALRGQARIYIDTVNPTKAEDLLQQALRLSDKLDDREARANLIELLAENQLNRGHSEEAQTLREQAQSLRDEGPGQMELDVRVLLRTGKLEKARQILEKRAAAEEREPVMQPRAYRETQLLLSFIQSCMGEGEAAYQNALKASERGGAFDSPFITAVALMRQGHAWLIRDEPNSLDQAYRCFQRAIEIGDNLAVPRLKVEANWGLCHIFGCQGQMERAEQAALQGIAIAQEAGDEWVASLICVSMGATCFLAQRFGAASEWLTRAYSGFRECSDTFGETVTRLWQCLVWNKTGDRVRLKHGLHDLLSLSKEHGYEYLYTRRTLEGPPDLKLLVPLLIDARSEGIMAAYATDLLEKVGMGRLEYHPGYQLRVNLLGSFKVWRGSHEVEVLEWQRDKARQLFLILLSSRGTTLDKNLIAGMLWPDQSEDAAHQGFRTTLNALYRVLEPERRAGAPSAYIMRDGKSLYGIRPEADIWLDVQEFERLIADGDQVFKENPAQGIDDYRRALKLYHGDYLEEFIYEEEWWRETRERLRVLYLRTADRLAQLLIDAKQWQEVIDVCQSIIGHDDCWERAYRLMMYAHAQMGNRPQAIRVYRRLVDRLIKDLDTIPSSETNDLYQKLLND